MTESDFPGSTSADRDFDPVRLLAIALGTADVVEPTDIVRTGHDGPRRADANSSGGGQTDDTAAGG